MHVIVQAFLVCKTIGEKKRLVMRWKRRVNGKPILRENEIEGFPEGISNPHMNVREG